MVIRDLSFSQTNLPATPRFSIPVKLPLAPVTDRFIALILDFLILSPVVSFIFANILRNLKTVLLLNSESEEAVVIWTLFLVGIVAASCLLVALSMYFWQATPGQKFMQLQVVPYPQALSAEGRLSFAQCLVRSFGWWLGVVMLGVPFLEIIGHPLRRAFHERVSDTIVISNKQVAADIPLAVESQYIGSTMWIFYGVMFVVGMVLMGQAYQTALNDGLGKRKVVSQAFCPDISADRYKDQRRLDLALALYFADEVDGACVFTEAQRAVWTLEGEDKALGQLAMAVINDDEEEAAAYQAKVCEESAKSEACAISNFLLSKDVDRGGLLRKSEMGLFSSRVLILKNSLDLKNYALAVGLIKDLDGESLLRNYLDKSLVRAAWALNAKGEVQLAGKGKNRGPASVDEKEILTVFKKRFNIE